MVVNDNLLVGLSKALNGEGFNIPSHMAEGSSTMSIATDSSVLVGEYASRQSLSGSRNNNIVSYNGLRTGASVASSSGEPIYTFAMYDSGSGGNLLTAVLTSSLLHTTSFDIDVDWEITVDRK